jgi:glycogen debranching enzyme
LITDLQSEFAIVAKSHTETPSRVLKQGDTFLLFDRHGDINVHGQGDQGLYREDTRLVSQWILLLGGERPLLLGSEISRSNLSCTIDLTNADRLIEGRIVLPRGSVHVRRTRFVHAGVVYERLTATSYMREPIEIPLFMFLDSDFADIFEVRGTPRARRGARSRGLGGPGSIVNEYAGLDGLRRSLKVETDPPAASSGGGLRWDLRLAPGESQACTITLSTEVPGAPEARPAIHEAAHASAQQPGLMATGARLESSHVPLNLWLERSSADLDMLMTATTDGPYPDAGVPWFSTTFGRDGLITALEVLWAQPAVARGVLRHLAAMQATIVDDLNDAQPGKILHEARRGEMARLREVPFFRYYGSVDATPLFVVLAARYFRRTGDIGLVSELWPNVLAALGWIERYGDEDGDGLVEYMRRSPNGLEQQGWKDSHDSVRHADGSIAPPPIALCEVQGYTYAAWQGAADLVRALGDDAEGARYEAQASRVAAAFEDRFWCEDLGTYALAVDGEKQACQVRSSNVGHCLFTGIAREDRGRRAAEALVAPESFSGWGIRTIASSEAFHNPMSYHNGSIWPHDSALVAGGLARYGRTDLALVVMQGLFEATTYFELHRLPELFCGFERRPGIGPTSYPVACSPQAWSAGAGFLLLQSALGLDIDAPNRTVYFVQPRLPEAIQHLHIGRLQVADGELSFACTRHAHDVDVAVMQRTGDLRVVVVK